MSGRRILLTGATGYLGGRIAQHLSAVPQVRVVIGGRTLRAAPAWLPGAETRVLDWRSSPSLEAACGGIDAVVHLAAMNEIDAAQDPARALEVNGVYTARLLEAAMARRVGRFVYMSTAHVYAAPLAGRIDETVCPRPQHPYATSHRAAEDVVLAAHDRAQLSGIVLRLSNGFGAPAHAEVQRWTLLVNDLCRQATVQRKLTLRSAGLQRRDFVTLHDVARAVAHFLVLPRERAADGLFNVGGNWAPRVIDMVELIQSRCQAVLGFTPPIIRPDPEPGEGSADLDYRIDRLLSTGFTLSGDATREIDDTLRLSANAFQGAGI